jgi:hypothetical protein
MSRPNSERRARALAAVAALGTLLAGCSDIYFDRRETIALGADDALAANQVTQMIDPWPLHGNNKNIAFNGEKMQTAVERYRTNKVIPPVNATTSSVAYQQAAQAAASATNAAQAGAGSAPPASGAPVK